MLTEADTSFFRSNDDSKGSRQQGHWEPREREEVGGEQAECPSPFSLPLCAIY